MESRVGTTENRVHFPARSVLFRSEASGTTYRIPALLYLQHCSCFLAFCEERLSPDDSHANLLVLRTGVLYRNYVEWEDMRVLSTASLKGYRSMNPSPVYDASTGTLFLFFIAVFGHTTERYQLVTGKNAARLCYITSQDDGKTWSPVTDLTEKVIGDTIKEWATFALGPGHGIQLKSGRLLIPAYAYHIDSRQCFGKLCRTTPHAFCFFSDTHGETWDFGGTVPDPECLECQLVSLDEEDGTSVLYANARSTLGARVQALSFNNGTFFQKGQLVHKLVEPKHGCHGSAIGFPMPFPSNIPGDQPPRDYFPPTWVVYGHPTRTDSRRDFGLYLNVRPRDPDSWSMPWVIYKGPSGYSDLAYVELVSTSDPPVPVFACLFESGTRTSHDEISFSMVTLFDLINNLPPSLKHLRSVRSAETPKKTKNSVFSFGFRRKSRS